MADAAPTYETMTELLIEYLPGLYRVARGYVLRGEEAEDLVHEACVRALHKFHTTPPRSTAAVRSWLHQILLNLFRDTYRRALRNPVTPEAYGYDNIVDLMPSLAPSPEDLVHGMGFSAALEDALAALPDDTRTVVVLVLAEGFTYAEVAEIAQCPIGTVMSRLSRGRSKLRQALAGFGETAVESVPTYVERTCQDE